MGDKISACIAWAACAICSDSDGPGNDSRRRPASHGEVEPRGVKAVSLNGDSWRAMYWLEIHSLIDKSRSYKFIIQCLHGYQSSPVKTLIRDRLVVWARYKYLMLLLDKIIHASSLIWVSSVNF